MAPKYEVSNIETQQLTILDKIATEFEKIDNVRCQIENFEKDAKANLILLSNETGVNTLVASNQIAFQKKVSKEVLTLNTNIEKDLLEPYIMTSTVSYDIDAIVNTLSVNDLEKFKVYKHTYDLEKIKKEQPHWLSIKESSESISILNLPSKRKDKV
jgi:hypothetical protein